MKTIKLTSILLIMLFSKTSTAQELANTITVIVTHIKSDDGTIQIGLYNSKNSFLNKTYKSTFVKAKTGKIEAIFKNIPEGEYAISLYHDKDNNKELNTFFSIPTEPYGTSNNAKGNYGPPKWEDAKFDVSNKNLTQIISL